MNTVYLILTRIASMNTKQSFFRRRRSSSLTTINTSFSDDEDFWSASSSRKTSKDSECRKKISLSAVQSASELHTMNPTNISNEIEYSRETLYNQNESHTVRESRTNSFQFDNIMCRRQSVSLPGFHEGLNSGKLVSRLSLVGDELEESLKQFKNSYKINGRRWTIFDSSTPKQE
ncbi:unnamed protein product [Schistosoma turkestanicum]|nr:unnamed protein product [Schistosoma turkestanicum]